MIVALSRPQIPVFSVQGMSKRQHRPKIWQYRFPRHWVFRTALVSGDAFSTFPVGRYEFPQCYFAARWALVSQDAFSTLPSLGGYEFPERYRPPRESDTPFLNPLRVNLVVPLRSLFTNSASKGGLVG